MQKYEKVTVVLLVMVVASIVILYMMASPDAGLIGSANSEYSDYSDSSNLGDSVMVYAKVLDMRPTFKGNHLILTVEPESVRTPLKVFIRNSAGADTISKEISVGDMIVVKGKVDEYEGEREIIVENRHDISKKTQ
ncbi:MAG: OB-fold nucleic acid binding domain-containing protein [Methanosarcinales archaeon]|nr:OB-fold nucleic acid binding domain-containing protein [Methanosarcinales archaeon]